MSSAGQGYGEGFFYSPEDQAAQQQIRRRQDYAKALLQGQQHQGQYGGLADAGSAIAGALLARNADKDATSLASTAQTKYASDLANLLKGNSGSGPSPQISSAAGSPQGLDPEGNPMSSMAGALKGPSPDPQGNPEPAMQPPAPQQQPQQGGFAGALAQTNNPALMAQFAPEVIRQKMQMDAKRLTPMNPQETQAMGLRGIWGRDAAGNPVPIQQSDVKSAEAEQQDVRMKQQGQLLTPEALAQKIDIQKASQGPAWANVNLAKQRLDMQQKGIIEPETLGFMADQVLAGDKSPFANIGRGAQGSENLSALRGEVMRRAQARGLGGSDLAGLNAEFSGLQAGQRTLGTRTANIEMAASEAQNLMPLALSASKAVPRSQYPSLNKIDLAIKQGTGDENVVRLGVAVNGLVNTYARAISPTGNPTVDDKNHARDILDKAWSNGQFEAAVGQMAQEIGAARKSPGIVRGEFRNAISGSHGGAASVPDAPRSGTQGGQARTVVRTGKDAQGNKVVQYSDGTIDHAP